MSMRERVNTNITGVMLHDQIETLPPGPTTDEYTHLTSPISVAALLVEGKVLFPR